jgi:hypothetical protein
VILALDDRAVILLDGRILGPLGIETPTPRGRKVDPTRAELFAKSPPQPPGAP